jgi:hypothetical protein
MNGALQDGAGTIAPFACRRCYHQRIRTGQNAVPICYGALSGQLRNADFNPLP